MTISLVKCSVDEVFVDTQRTWKYFSVSECSLSELWIYFVNKYRFWFIIECFILYRILAYIFILYLFDMVVFSRNPALKNPEIVAQRGGLSTILKNVIDCQLSRINEALITTILHLLNHPHTRQYIRADVELEVCVHAAAQIFVVVQV